MPDLRYGGILPIGPIAKVPSRAAQYVRMSTDQQDYSIENQTDVIEAYARSREIQITRSYADGGRSGLRLDDRPALKELLQDVQSGAADFDLILVHDVSRWGRFQDIDESAYYEHLCKRSGIRVVYCAESFENDDGLISALIKSLKRAMAGEYSRELSNKVFVGQCKLVREGFWQGAQPGYGLRRALVGADGSRKAVLLRGERKNIQSDRVILVPGPPKEIETVRRIFRAFVSERKSTAEIARELVADEVAYREGRPWTKRAVRTILFSEKYAGHNVFNRVARKLNGKPIPNAREHWVRSENVFEAIVDPSLLAAARQRDAEERAGRSAELMLGQLKELFEKEGRLSTRMINASPDLPHSCLFRVRFGTLEAAYERVGFQPERTSEYLDIRRALAAKFAEIVSHVVDSIKCRGHNVVAADRPNSFVIDDAFSLAIVVVRLARHGSRRPRWVFQNCGALRSDQVAAITVDDVNHKPVEYYMFPGRSAPSGHFTLGGGRKSFARRYRLDSLEDVLSAIDRCVAHSSI
jgi:DNA invertase Pin-like site-specific DNA recombinase